MWTKLTQSSLIAVLPNPITRNKKTQKNKPKKAKLGNKTILRLEKQASYGKYEICNNAHHKLSNSCVNKIATPCPTWLSPAAVGTQGSGDGKKMSILVVSMQGKEKAGSVGTGTPLGEDTLPSGWSITSIPVNTSRAGEGGRC